VTSIAWNWYGEPYCAAQRFEDQVQAARLDLGRVAKQRPSPRAGEILDATCLRSAAQRLLRDR